MAADTGHHGGDSSMITTRFILRTYHRFPVHCSFYYLGDGFVGQGTVWNLSTCGWRVSGDYPVLPGVNLMLRLFLPDQISVIEVDCATVQWLRGQEFGLQIVTIQPEAEARLTQFVTSLANNRMLSSSNLFPIINGQGA